MRLSLKYGTMVSGREHPFVICDRAPATRDHPKLSAEGDLDRSLKHELHGQNDAAAIAVKR